MAEDERRYRRTRWASISETGTTTDWKVTEGMTDRRDVGAVLAIGHGRDLYTLLLSHLCIWGRSVCRDMRRQQQQPVI